MQKLTGSPPKSPQPTRPTLEQMLSDTGSAEYELKAKAGAASMASMAADQLVFQFEVGKPSLIEREVTLESKAIPYAGNTGNNEPQ